MARSVGAEQVSIAPTVTLCSVARLQPSGATTECVLAGSPPLSVSRVQAGFIQVSDQIEFDPSASDPGHELRIIQQTSRNPKELYFASVGYVTQPKPDKRSEYFVRAAVEQGRLGIKYIHLPNDAVRDYFYFGDRKKPGCEEHTFFETLRTTSAASPADLRLALKVRMLELEAEGAPQLQFQAVERAFNLLAHPEIRSCYERLLADPENPALFPYGGFGVLFVSGELSKDRETFFAGRIISFLPNRRQRQFRVPLRKIEFFDGHALLRHSGHKAEVFLDSVSLPLHFDATWNQWKHLVSTRLSVAATFVQSGKYRFRAGEWQLVTWETALPSRTTISVPAGAQAALAEARQTFHRFGQHSDVLQELRVRLEKEPLAREELLRICDKLRVPPDFDIALISWKPDYDAFYYRQLLKRTRKLYLFRDEYIFDLERAAVVEVPQQGHATYVFARPGDVDAWVRRYSQTAKADIRNNRLNVAESLGFLGRVMHGRDPKTWLRELRLRIGEPVDYSTAIAI